jgi:pilus assembly protein CpaC
VITARGTIRLEVTPEVSSLDFANGLVFQGFTIPALSTRRVQTEVELRSGQSFAIAGLLDKRTAESWSKVPGIGDIPILGKLFQSRSLLKNDTELMVLVTPEIVSTVETAAAGEAPKKLPVEELMRLMSARPKRTEDKAPVPEILLAPASQRTGEKR